jgi:hypothetical protein
MQFARTHLAQPTKFRFYRWRRRVFLENPKERDAASGDRSRRAHYNSLHERIR